MSSKKSKNAASIPASGKSKSPNKLAQSTPVLALPKQQLEELSQAVEQTTLKFDKLINGSNEMVQKSAQNPKEMSKTQESVNQQVEEQGFNMIQKIFDKIGGQKAIMTFLEKRHPQMQREPEGSIKERKNEGSPSTSMRQSSVIEGKPKNETKAVEPKGLQITSHVTNQKRSALAANGMIQPFDQVMSNFAMYGLANRNTLSGPVDTSPTSQVEMMQELTGLCLKIYRSVNLRFQRIAQMMLSGNTQELKELIETNFCYKMVSYQSLVLTRISENCLMVDEPGKKIGIIDERALVKQHELHSPEGNALRSSLQVRNYIFTGYSNGILQRLDSETLEVDIVIILHTHVFCIELFDNDHIICGQMNGWIDLVNIESGEIVLSKELKHITGNITMMLVTDRENEVMLATQRGIYFALIGKGLGIMEVEMERFDKSYPRFQKHLTIDEEQQSMSVRNPDLTERAEITTMGAKHSEIDGMSQMTFHTQSRFGAQDQIDDGAKSNLSNTQTVYTKPFTMQSVKGSEKSKMQGSIKNGAGTEVAARTTNGSQIIKKKVGQASDVQEKASEGKSQYEAMGTVAQTNQNSVQQSKADLKGAMQSQQIQSRSILKNSDNKLAQVKKSQFLSPSKINGELHEDSVRQSVNSHAIGANLKQVTHADQQSTYKNSIKDSEIPTQSENANMDVQDRESNSRGSGEEDEMRFVLCAERYLVGKDIRGIVHLELERYGVVVWNDSKVYSVDREKPEAVIQFNMPVGEKNCISMRLIPFYDVNQFPFAIVLCQTSICCIDFKRYNAFKVCPWRYKGVPNNVNQLEMHLSKEEDQVGEQINIVTLEFDGSNSFVRRLVLDHDCIQALNFLGQD